MALRARITNKQLYLFHGWMGLSFGLILFIICLSGTFAVVSHEIDWLLTPAVRACSSSEDVDWRAIRETLARQYPSSAPAWIWAPEGPGFAAQVWLRDSAYQRRIHVDPGTGEVLGETAWFNTQRFFRDFHRRFFWYSSWGVTLVSSFAIVLLLSASTGLLFYKRWWLKLLTLRVHMGRRVFWSDLHRLTGVWTLLFALAIGATGIWYLIESPAARLIKQGAPELPRLPRSRLAELPPNAVPLPVEQYAAIAHSVDPELRITSILLPAKLGNPVEVQGQAEAWLVRDRANKVLLDPYSGDVLMHQRAEQLDPLVRWIDTADPLHFGDFGGLTTKLIWFAFGLILSVAMPTGAYLWVKRAEQITAGITRRLQGGSDAELTREVRRATKRRIGSGVVITTAILLMAVMATYQALKEQLPQAEPPRAVAAAQTLGPWTVSPFWKKDTAVTEEATVGVEFDQRSGHPNFRRVAFAFGQGPPPDGSWIAADGGLYEQRATLALPASDDECCGPLWLRIESWNNEQYIASFDSDAFGLSDNGSARNLVALTPEWSLGGPRVIAFYCSFVAIVVIATTLWYRAVWFRRPPRAIPRGD